MHWGINARRLEGQPYGMGRYIEYMIKYWQRLAPPDDRVELYLRAPLDRDGLHDTANFRFQVVGPRLTGITWENFSLARRARGLDVLFCPNYSAPLRSRVPAVVAIHSVNELRAGAHAWWYQYTYSQLYRRSAHQAAVVIAPLETTRRQIVEAYRVPADKIVVIPQGADDTFGPVADAEVLRATRRKYLGDDRPYVLFVGQLSQRRNTPALIEGFARLKKRTGLPHRLLLFGRNNAGHPIEQLAAGHGIPGEVVQTDGRVASHRELVPVYAGADLFVFPSLAEGFSMTTVEALTCGLPVVATDSPALREMVGGCALMVDDGTPDQLAAGMERVLTDPALARELRAKSLDRARVYRWEACARDTLDVIRQVGSGGRSAAPAGPAAMGGVRR